MRSSKIIRDIAYRDIDFCEEYRAFSSDNSLLLSSLLICIEERRKITSKEEYEIYLSYLKGYGSEYKNMIDKILLLV